MEIRGDPHSGKTTPVEWMVEHLPLMVDPDKSAPASYAMLSRRHDRVPFRWDDGTADI